LTPHTGSVSNERDTMKIKLTNVYVDDQEKALRFYTEVLGFTKQLISARGRFAG
jgi:predicted enzyme related to lactoylglutathione lyase